MTNPGESESLIRRRVLTYWAVGVGLVLVSTLFQPAQWQVSPQLRTIMHVIGTNLATIVGSMALVWFYARRDHTILVIGAAFLGMGVLEALHSIESSPTLRQYLASSKLLSLHGSWLASGVFLAPMLLLRLLVLKPEKLDGEALRIQPGIVYGGAFLLLIVALVTQIFLALWSVNLSGSIVPRPPDLIPTFLLGLTLILSLQNGGWRRGPFEHWLVIALIVMLVSHTTFMLWPGRLFDTYYLLAHVLRNVAYVCVLAGLFATMFVSFRRVEREVNERQVAQQALEHSKTRHTVVLDTMVDGQITIDEHGIIQSMNPAVTRKFGYAEEDLLGKNISMLMPEPDRSKHDGYIRKYLATGEAHIIGFGRAVVGRCRDGTDLAIDLAVSEMVIDGRRLFSGIMHDVSEYQRQQDELARSAQELARSNEELERFASAASHDLQEPLRTVANFTELLEQEYGDRLDGEATEYMAFIVDGARRMKRLIDALLAFSRVGTKGVSHAPVQCDELVEDVILGMEAAIDENGAKVVYHNLPEVLADRALLSRLFQNLISNAIKFRTEHPPEVKIAGVSTEGEWRISVQDNGIGIDPRFSDRIFAVFQRLHDYQSYPGTGIGLSIAKKIVELHGGRIWVDSREGGGATFNFTLPKNAS